MTQETRWRVTFSGGKTSEPVDEATIRRMIEEGELRRSSMVLDENTGSWVPIKMVPSLWALFPQEEPAEAEPPKKREEHAAPAQVEKVPGMARAEEVQQVSVLPLAVLSLAFGVASFAPFVRAFLWLLGIIAASSAIIRSNRNAYRGAGGRLAVFGLLLNLAGGVLFVGGAAMQFMGYRTSSNQQTCLMQLSAVSKAMQAYAADNDDRFPLAVVVDEPLTSAKCLSLLVQSAYISDPSVLYCPQCREGAGEDVDGRTYAYVSGLRASTPGFIPLMLDDLWAEEDFRAYPFDAHGVGGCNVLYVDGSAEWVASSAMGDARGAMPELGDDAAAAAQYEGNILWGHAAPGDLD